MSSDFYSRIKPHSDFDAFADGSLYLQPPADWSVIISDVMNSTGAIESGRYRDVNLVGASTIIAVLNVAGKTDVPFVFGGDGATLLVPPDLLEPVRQSLAETQKMSQRLFGLQLRVGAVRVSEILDEKKAIGVSKLSLSNKVSQAMFHGDGFAWAEKRIKDPALRSRYLIGAAPAAEDENAGRYDGLECRWQNIRSETGEVHSWLILSTRENSDADFRMYDEVMKALKKAYGAEAGKPPVERKSLHLTVSPFRLLKEVRIRFSGLTGWPLFKEWAYAYLGTQLSRFFFLFKTKTFGTDWSKYQDDVPRNTDYRKFDGMLRMTLAGTRAQREAFESELRGFSEKKWIAYGLHVSTSSLMTCMVFDRAGRHIHFVDGSDGGYAMAAKRLKASLQARLSS